MDHFEVSSWKISICICCSAKTKQIEALRCFLPQRSGMMDQSTTDRVLALGAQSPSNRGYHPYLKSTVLVLN